MRGFRLLLAALLPVLLLIHPVVAVGQTASWVNFAGLPGGAGTADGSGNAARFSAPAGVAMDSANNVYVADSTNHTIRKITSAGVVTTLAGMPGVSGSADGSGSTARFNNPFGIAVDTGGTLYVADQSNQTIRKITSAGVVSTLAGNVGVPGSDDGAGAAASFNLPGGVAVDASGNVYVADSGNHTIRKITAAGVVSTLAGSAGVSGSDNGTGAGATFNTPLGVAVNSTGDLFVADQGNMVIRKVTSAGVVSTYAGTAGTPGSTDGAATTAALFESPTGVALDGSGNLYVTDLNGCTLRKITSTGTVSTLAGGVDVTGSTDGSGTAARFYYPVGVAANASGIFVGDYFNNTIRKVTSAGVVTTLAGRAASVGSADGTGTAATFSNPAGMAADSSGNLYVSDQYNNTIRMITSTGVVSTFAGTAGVFGNTDDMGANASFCSPAGMAYSPSGILYVADTFSHIIRAITAQGVVSTLAGQAFAPGSGDGTGTGAQFQAPVGVAVDAGGTIYVADTGNHTIRTVTADGVVGTLAGSAGQPGSADGSGSNAQFNHPSGVAVDANGNVYVTDTGNHTIREITSGGVVTTLAGGAGIAGSTDATGNAARFHSPGGIVVDVSGNLYVSDTGNSTIRKISPAGVVITIGGTAGAASGKDGIGAAALFNAPAGLVASGGFLYVCDGNENRVVKGTAPDISVELPGGTALADGSGGVSFGIVAVNTTQTLTLTVRNNGISSLTGLAVTKDGTNNSEFTVGALGTTTLAPGATTTFTVAYKPTATGARTAALHIASNVNGAKNPFDVNLVGGLSSEAHLSALAISQGTLAPAFATGTYAYTATVANDITSLTVTPTVMQSGATLKVNGVAVASGTPSAAIPLAPGSNAITTVVTAPDGATTQTYTVTVTRIFTSNEARLSGLSISQGALTPAFFRDTFAYDVGVGTSITSLTVTPTVMQANATVKVNGVTVASGSPSAGIPLNVGQNVITTVVTAQDGVSTHNYVVTVTRAAPSGEAHLTGLAVSQGTLTPAFSSGTNSYTASVANTITNLTVTPTVAQANATVTVNGVTVASGTPSAAIPLAPGPNTISTVVTAQDGVTTQTYTVTVTRSTVSSEAHLSALALSQGTLAPAFDGGTNYYSASVANAITSMTVTPTVLQADATVKVNGVAVASGSPSVDIALSVGPNVILTVVTAQDGTTTQTYAVTVTRFTHYETWVAASGLATENAGTSDDPDNDGRTNFLEYAFGANPLSGDAGPMTLSGTTITRHGDPFMISSPTPKAVFARRDDYVSGGLTYVVQFSADLKTWTNSTTTPTVLADDGVVQAVSVPFPSGAKQFFRVLVTTGTVVLATPYETWATAANLTSGNSGKLSDPDQDGRTNLLEYAFGTNPLSGDTGPLTLNGSTITRHGDPFIKTSPSLQAVFARRDDYVSGGLTYIVQFSADLQTWTNSSATPTVLADDGVVQAVSVPFPSGAKQFFRVLVSMP